METYWNKRVKALEPYTPGEQPRDGAFIKLNTNENPYPPPESVFAAIKNAANERLRLYPDPSSLELRKIIAAKYGVETENVFAGNGSDEILAFAFGSFFESESENAADASSFLLLPDITYSFYPVYAKLWNIPFKTIPLKNWEVHIEDYKLPEAGGVVLANPNAPTGIAIAASEILSLSASLAERNRVLIIDEAYCDFGGESVVPYIKNHPNLLVVRTLSKSFSLAGLRLGFCLGGAPLIKALERLRDSFNSYTVDFLSQNAAAAALKDTTYYDKIILKIIKTRERVVLRLLELSFTALPSSANFIFIKHPSLGGAEFYAYLRENSVLVRHFNKPEIKDFLRVTIGSDRDMDVFLNLCAVSLN